MDADYVEICLVLNKYHRTSCVSSLSRYAMLDNLPFFINLDC